MYTHGGSRGKLPVWPRIALVVLLSSVGAAQIPTCCKEHAWVQRSSLGPSGRDNFAMAFDTDQGKAVLFGGREAPNGLKADTWLWNGTAWSQVFASGPSARFGHRMAYDQARHEVVLFGGNNLFTNNAETWVWNGSTWTQKFVGGPSGRAQHSMVWDSMRQVIVLFGGVAGNFNTWLGDTWEWNGTAWSLRATSGPAARSGHGFAYDSLRGVSVLFGGDASNTPMGDTWEWNGTAWSLRATSGPAARSAHAMTYLAGCSRTMLFSGRANSTLVDDTWQWDGTAWNQIVLSAPAKRGLSSATYDPLKKALLLFGGNDFNSFPNYKSDTWELSGAVNPCVQCVSVPKEELVGWWRLDENGGPTASDSSGRGNHGTKINGPTTTAGVFWSKALRFDGVNDYVQIPHSASLNIGPGGPFAIDFWLHLPQGIPTGMRVIIDKRKIISNKPRGYHVYLNSGKVWLQVADGNTFKNIPGPSLPAITVNQPILVGISVTRTGITSKVEWFVDGQTSTTNEPTMPQGTLSTTAPLLLGRHSLSFNGAPFLRGHLDEVEVFRRTIPTALFQLLRDGPKCAFQ